MNTSQLVTSVRIFVLSMALLSLGLASQAHANAWMSTTGTISAIRVANTGVTMVQIRNDSAQGPNDNPGSCLGGWILPVESMSQTEKESLGRGLLAAYLAGRQIRMKLNSACTGDNLRQYYQFDIL